LAPELKDIENEITSDLVSGFFGRSVSNLDKLDGLQVGTIIARVTLEQKYWECSSKRDSLPNTSRGIHKTTFCS